MHSTIIGGIAKFIRIFLKIDDHSIIVVPPTNNGSLGDQAMVDVTCQQLFQKYNLKPIVIMDPNQEFSLRTHTNICYIPAPQLLSYVSSILQILKARYMVFLGADVIDGVYGGACRRLKLLDLAHQANIETAALGFSISKTPGKNAVKQLQYLPDMPMHVRDPVSLIRFNSIGKSKGIQVADLAFLLQPEARTNNSKEVIDWAKQKKAEGYTILALNAGGTTITKMGDKGIEAYKQLLSAWLKADPLRAILFVPHDTRPDPVGDIGPLQNIKKYLSQDMSERVHMLNPPFDAWDAKAVAGVVDFAMTARMHFAIACLGMGVPALCVTYQGKFEGLMEHFQLEDMLLTPEDVLDKNKTLKYLNNLEGNLAKVRAQIKIRLPKVKDLSEQNFKWL